MALFRDETTTLGTRCHSKDTSLVYNGRHSVKEHKGFPLINQPEQKRTTIFDLRLVITPQGQRNINIHIMYYVPTYSP